MKSKPKFGYMCSIDWKWELGEALGGNTVYPSIEDLKDNHSFDCGIIKVKIEFEEEIEKGKW